MADYEHRELNEMELPKTLTPSHKKRPVLDRCRSFLKVLRSNLKFDIRIYYNANLTLNNCLGLNRKLVAT
jgi:hypothetical protein